MNRYMALAAAGLTAATLAGCGSGKPKSDTDTARYATPQAAAEVFLNELYRNRGYGAISSDDPDIEAAQTALKPAGFKVKETPAGIVVNQKATRCAATMNSHSFRLNCSGKQFSTKELQDIASRAEYANAPAAWNISIQIAKEYQAASATDEVTYANLDFVATARRLKSDGHIGDSTAIVDIVPGRSLRVLYNNSCNSLVTFTPDETGTEPVVSPPEC